jgi:hypothetical protein
LTIAHVLPGNAPGTLGRMVKRIFVTAALVATVAGCGGNSSSSGGTGNAGSGGKLVAKVQHADAKVEGSSVVGTVEVTDGGRPGQRLALRYGLVDAVSGTRASQDERLVAHYTTRATIASKDVTIKFPKPTTPTDYLLHFVLYGPDGSFLASSDSHVFTVQ